MHKHVIGLSIAPQAIRLVEVACHKNGRAVSRAAVAPVADLRAETLAAALGQLLSAGKTRRADVICALDLPEMFLGKIVTPKMPRREVVEAIRWEVREHLTFPAEQAVIDHTLLETLRGGASEKFSLLAAAAPRGAVEQIRAAFRLLNADRDLRHFHLAKLVPGPLAAAHLYRRVPPGGKDLAVVQLDDEIITMTFMRDQGVELFRRLPMAGKDITTSMTKALVSPEGKIELSLLEAGEIKETYGITRRDSDEIVAGKISGKQIFVLIRPQLEKLINEVRRSVNFYAQKSGYPVGLVLLSGPGSRIKGLAGYLEEQLEMNVVPADATAQVAVIPSVIREHPGFGQDFDQALGAALQPPEEINLLARQRAATAATGPSWPGFAVLLAVVGAVSLVFGWAHIEKFQALRQWDEARRDYEAVSSRVDEVQLAVALAAARRNRPDWHAALQTVSRVVPEEIYFSEMWSEEDVLYVKGMLTSGSGDDRAGLTGFTTALDRELCERTQLLQVREVREKEDGTEFRLSCDIPLRITWK